mgnify:CR=1 FL=1
MATSEDISIQTSALTVPIDGLSLPSVDLVGQTVSHSDLRAQPTFNTANIAVVSNRGPNIEPSADNIQFFSDIFDNYTSKIETTINGVVIEILVSGFAPSIITFSKASKKDLLQSGYPEESSSTAPTKIVFA